MIARKKFSGPTTDKQGDGYTLHKEAGIPLKINYPANHVEFQLKNKSYINSVVRFSVAMIAVNIFCYSKKSLGVYI